MNLKSLAITLVALVAILPAGAVLAQEDTTKPANPTPATSKPAKVDLGDYKDLVTVCKLSQEQVAELGEKVLALQKGMEERKAKTADLSKQLKDAKAASDADKAKALQQDLDKALAENTKIYNDLRFDVMAVLKPEQRIMWEANKVDAAIEKRYAKYAFQFDDAQKKKLAAVVQEIAKELAEVNDATNFQAEQDAFKKAYAKVEETVLNEEQWKLVPGAAKRATTPTPAPAPAVERNRE